MVLLVIDTQDMIMTEQLYEFDRFVKNVNQLITTARQKGAEIVFVRHDDGVELTKGVEGFDIYRQFAPLDNEKIFDKNYNSAFRNTGLVEYLKSKNESQIMITGIQTDYCIDATVKCGFEHGYQVFVPALCNTTVPNEFMTAEQSYKYYNHKMWHKRYASCISLEEALALL